ARHVGGTALLFADRITESMRRAIAETERRRAKQEIHNTEHGLTARSVVKRVRDLIDGVHDGGDMRAALAVEQERARYEALDAKALGREIRRIEKAMMEAARNLEFETAARLRDELSRLRELAFGADPRSAD
ncbi:MAG TPA: excinuclease ABC subunit B, partial [Rhodocyclaceae bacterium]|nr:excinuclease ABC subunit B [Rhodocyclaceae bacterium]